MKKTLFLLAAVTAGALSVTQAANVYDLDMTFDIDGTYNVGSAYDWPDSPDLGSITNPDFFFTGGASTWNLNDASTTIIKQTRTAAHRFFVGTNDGPGSVTFTSNSGVAGSLSGRGNGYAAMRIGEGSTSGIVNIEGGATVDFGYTFGSGSGTNQLNILDGEFGLITSTAGKRLNDIDVTIGANGALWLEDAGGAIIDVASFEAYASGSSLTATSGQTLVFTNLYSRDTVDGAATLTGTMITAVPEPSSSALLGVGGLTLIMRRRK